MVIAAELPELPELPELATTFELVTAPGPGCTFCDPGMEGPPRSGVHRVLVRTTARGCIPMQRFVCLRCIDQLYRAAR